MINTNDLKQALKENILNVTFKKIDGTQRVMKCTLQEALLPKAEKESKQTKKPNDSVLAVWDLEKEAFRSFRLDCLLSYTIC